jgi:hypothetical protein
VLRAQVRTIAATNYAASLDTEVARFSGISDPARHALTDNVGSALHTSGQLGVNGTEIASLARTRSSTR